MNEPKRSPAMDNIQAVAKVEQQFLERRTLVQRIGDAIGGFAGSMSFVVIHLVLLTLWFIINKGLIPGIRSFDPYPFMFLSMAVSIEAVLLSTFVLMKQNRESKRAEQREQLTLQIDLLAEQEITKVLQLLQQVCDRLGIKDVLQDPEVKRLAEHTAVDKLAEELKDKLPEK
jgi:uncharacterized membrane protein